MFALGKDLFGVGGKVVWFELAASALPMEYDEP
jgi:hypothetical protein